MAYTELRKEHGADAASELPPAGEPSPGPGPVQGVLRALEAVQAKDTGRLLDGNSTGGDTLR